MIIVIVIVILAILIWQIYDVFVVEEINNNRVLTGMDMLNEISDIINMVRLMDFNSMSDDDKVKVKYILDESFIDLTTHKDYYTKDFIKAYRDIYEKVKMYYYYITPDGKISQRNEAIEEILK